MSMAKKFDGTDALVGLKQAVYARASDNKIKNRQLSTEAWGFDVKVLDDNCQAMPDAELAPALLYALMNGDNFIAERLWQQRGPFPVQLVRQSNGAYELNGQPHQLVHYQQNGLLYTSRSAPELMRLFQNIRDMQVNGLVSTNETGQGIFRAGTGVTSVADVCRTVIFEGVVPTLDNERLKDPELLMGLLEAGKDSIAGRAYEPMLCWATPAMVAAYPEHLHPFHARHEASCRSTIQRMGTTQSLSAWQARFAAATEANEPVPDLWNLTISAEAVSDDIKGQYVLHAMAPATARYGFLENDNLQLCHTTTSFLSEFQIPQACNTANLALVEQFMSQYLPFDLLTLEAFPDGKLSHSISNGLVSSSISDVFDALALDDAVGSNLARLMSPEQWRALGRSCVIKGSAMSRLHAELGIDNQGFLMSPSQQSIEALHDQGFKFYPGSQVIGNKFADSNAYAFRSSGETIVDLTTLFSTIIGATKTLPDYFKSDSNQSCYRLAQMGIWPFEKHAPVSVADALKVCGRMKDPMGNFTQPAIANRTFLVSAGAEACTAAARSVKEWTFLLELLGVDAMRPYLHQMPSKPLAQAFSQDLGL
jgi:hypothetical protein